MRLSFMRLSFMRLSFMRLSFMRLSVLFLALLAAPAAWAQLAEGGARSLALGRAALTLGADAWHGHNPAAPARLPGPALRADASEAFRLRELRLGAGAVALPTRLGVASLNARTYGAEAYRETRLSAGLARRLPLSPARRLDAGLALSYDAIAIEGFVPRSALALSAGLHADVLPALAAGVAARNVTALARRPEDDLRLPAASAAALAAGLAYRPAEGVLVLAEAEHDGAHGLALRGGLEAYPVPALALRLGAGSGPTRYSGGAGLRAGALRVDLAAEWHAALGLTPALSVAYAP
ncbi:MAG: hypothetical protein ACK41D_00075 [Rubricoccaceae bacterium]